MILEQVVLNCRDNKCLKRRARAIESNMMPQSSHRDDPHISSVASGISKLGATNLGEAKARRVNEALGILY